MKRFISGILIAMTIGMVYSCGNTTNDKKVTIAYVNWAEGVAMTHLSKVLLEREGYTVDLKNADVAPVFAAVAGGDADIFLDTWMPITHKDYIDKFGAKLEMLGTNFKNARIGLVVPDYVKVNSIEELNANAAMFDGKIVGIDAGAGIMNKAEAAVKDYGLKLELQSASEAAMLAILKKSIDAKQAVVITGWSPHYIFSNYKLKFLNDPKGVFGAIESIQTVANKDFVLANPQVTTFFRNFQLDGQELSSLMAAMESEDNEKVAVEKWLKEHVVLEGQMRSFLKMDSN
ncbi:glycine betaine/proline transport system substrate-binding protein [Pedobacter steynii]|uniref:Glycine betaine/proline transport system substrate-binding protein n=1 Tax=Pedobacter steynii TaxID=430522 RepID=A0A1G9YG73_9SPHI|nr:glycine betaine ABC transporter substrate-binding protein [Pedobacter steynii]NQX39711.1 glycine betaine ABC transporter substrate-binding protein [Pedobacter steynii]SDN08027.1 glycine betaine/proline transport system substrate-binding protein [Pedobacter steynii]